MSDPTPTAPDHKLLTESRFEREREADADAAIASLDDTILRPPLLEPIDFDPSAPAATPAPEPTAAQAASPINATPAQHPAAAPSSHNATKQQLNAPVAPPTPNAAAGGVPSGATAAAEPSPATQQRPSFAAASASRRPPIPSPPQEPYTDARTSAPAARATHRSYWLILGAAAVLVAAIGAAALGARSTRRSTVGLFGVSETQPQEDVSQLETPVTAPVATTQPVEPAEPTETDEQPREDNSGDITMWNWAPRSRDDGSDSDGADDTGTSDSDSSSDWPYTFSRPTDDESDSDEGWSFESDDGYVRFESSPVRIEYQLDGRSDPGYDSGYGSDSPTEYYRYEDGALTYYYDGSSITVDLGELEQLYERYLVGDGWGYGGPSGFGGYGYDSYDAPRGPGRGW